MAAARFFGSSDLHVDHRDLVRVRREILQDLFLDERLRQFARPDDATDGPIMVRQFENIPDLQLALLGEFSSMSMSSGFLKGRPAGNRVRRSFFEAVQIDPGDAFQSADAVQHDALGECDVRLLLDERDILFGHRSDGHPIRPSPADESGCRLRHLGFSSLASIMPRLKPTMVRTKVTWRPMARTVRRVRRVGASGSQLRVC